MEKILQRMKEYKEEIGKKQDLFNLIEAIEQLEIQSAKSNYYSTYNVTIKDDFIIQTYIKLFDQLLDELIAKDFIIDLNDTSLDEYDEEFKIYEKSNATDGKELIRKHNRMGFSAFVLNKNKDSSVIDLIELLILMKQYDVIMELILSEKVSKEQKFSIMLKIIKKSPSELENIVYIIPEFYIDEIINTLKSDDSNFEQQTKELKSVIKSFVDSNLQAIFEDRKKEVEEIIVTYIKTRCNDWTTRNDVNNTIKFFVKHNLVDMNEIIWSHDDKPITSAAAAYIMRKQCIGEYLYNLPDYINNDELIISYSDMVIAKHLLCHQGLTSVHDFVGNPNYVNNKEKFFCLIDMINVINESKIKVGFSQEKLESTTNQIIETLLRKTPKDEYKKIRKELKAREENEKLIVERRKELTTILKKVNDRLLEEAPAKSKVKEYNFKN